MKQTEERYKTGKEEKGKAWFIAFIAYLDMQLLNIMHLCIVHCFMFINSLIKNDNQMYISSPF